MDKIITINTTCNQQQSFCYYKKTLFKINHGIDLNFDHIFEKILQKTKQLEKIWKNLTKNQKNPKMQQTKNKKKKKLQLKK